MKKLTLLSLILFIAVVLGIFGMNLAYPPVDTTTQTDTQTTVISGGDSVALTVSEIATHDTQEDCYLIVDSKVYDVSSYFGKHPGGNKTISSRCGEEVTGIFSSIHSNFAWDLLTDYYLGPLVAEGSVSDPSSSQSTLTSIEEALLAQYPGAEIINVKPKNDFYVAKLIYQNSLYEIHVDASGTILSEEVENDEYDWSNWDTDADDLQ